MILFIRFTCLLENMFIWIVCQSLVSQFLCSVKLSFFCFSAHQVSRFSEENCHLPAQTGCKYCTENMLYVCCVSFSFITQFVKWLLYWSPVSLFCLSQVQLPDKIVIYELNTDDISDMHYKVKVTETLSFIFILHSFVILSLLAGL